MTNFQGSSFEAGRNKLKYILVFDAVAAIGAMFIPETAAAPRTVVSIAVIIGFAAAIYTVVKECRCPYCGKVIFLGVLNVRECPKCRRNLITGKKIKKSKK